MGDCSVGIVGKDFVMLMVDTTVARSIVAFKHDEDKIVKLDAHKLLATSGDHASRTSFAELIEKNMALMTIQTDLELSTHACAHFIRHEVARALRSRGPVQCNVLLGGVDSTGPALYYVDYLGSLQKLDFAAQGYVGHFALSILDKGFRKDLSREEAHSLMVSVYEQLKLRFLLHVPSFMLKTVSMEGTTQEILGGA
jgi:20S proteasome subunit beta 4